MDTLKMLQLAVRIAAIAFYRTLNDPEDARVASWHYVHLSTIKSRDNSTWDTGSGWEDPAHIIGYVAKIKVRFAMRYGKDTILQASIAMLADGRPTAVQFTLNSRQSAEQRFIVRQQRDGFVLSPSNY